MDKIVREDGTVKYIIECICGSEALSIQLNPIDGDEDIIVEDYITFWQNGYVARSMTFKEKLRLIKHIITKGTPFGDQIMMYRKDLKEAIKKINEDLNG